MQHRKTIGSRGEEVSDSDFSAESVASILFILGVCVCNHFRADGHDGDGVGDGDGDGDGDGIKST